MEDGQIAYTPPPGLLSRNGNLRRIPKHLELGIRCPGASVISGGFSPKILHRSLGVRLQVYVQLRLLFPVPTGPSERNVVDWKTAEERNLPARFRFVGMWKRDLELTFSCFRSVSSLEE